jgi:hypothetical protein
LFLNKQSKGLFNGFDFFLIIKSTEFAAEYDAKSMNFSQKMAFILRGPFLGTEKDYYKLCLIHKLINKVIQVYNVLNTIYF